MQNIIITTTVNITLQKAWDAFTKPEYVMQWNYASPDWHCPAATNNMQVGGEFHYTMAAKDGSFSFDFWAIYNVIENLKLIQCTMGDGRFFKTTFEQKAEGILVIEEFEPEKENPIEMQQQGWQSILNNYKLLAESI